MQEIFTRVSIRVFTPEPVAADAVQKLLAAGMQAPSAGNQQPWEFIVIEDAAMREKLAAVSPYAKPLLSAPLGIVILLNDSTLRFPECWQQDLSACAQNILLECVHLGLGAVWLAIADFPERMAAAKALFGLPEHLSVFAVLAIGHPGEEKKAVSRYRQERVHYGTYARPA
ncbi:MAG: nitroreductase family protein [Zoogloeaceae bacterium]|jgi:nitroreductase|nr:nitroreductase family protein [Zoogloeaceae bacterium]